MGITIYNYIDTNATALNNNVAATAASSENEETQSFEDALNAAKKAVAAVAIDKLVSASQSGSVDSARVQEFFDQHNINISVVDGGNSTDTTSVSADYSATSADYSNSGDLTCSDEMEEIFKEASEKYGVDIKLLKSIGKTESNFNSEATSSSGAMGVMQLMPATASELGVDDAYDSYENIMGGAKLISSLLDKYDGDISLALAAYNAGSGNVDKYGGIPPFTETQNYVKKVLGFYNS